MATLREMQEALEYYSKEGDTASVRQLIDAIRAAQNSATAAQAEDPGAMQAALIGAGRTVDRVGKGIKQIYHGAMGHEAELAALKAQADDEDRLYKPLQEAHPMATGIGESLPSVAVPVGGGAGLLANMARMGVSAAVPAALEYGSPEERLKRAAAAGAAGAASPAVMKAAGATLGVTGRAARSIIEPFLESGRDRIIGRTLQRVTADTPGAEASLRGARTLVAGSLPTAAQVGESGGLAALERAAKAAAPDAFAQRGQEQAAARINALRTVAGDDATLQRALRIRQEAADKSYKHAYMAGVDQDAAKMLKPQIDDLLTRPSVKSAMRNARRLAKEDGINIDTFGSVQGLHFLKESLDDQISGLTGRFKMQRRVLQTKNDLMKVLEEIAPEYREATARYARLSKPVNRMQVGQKLLEKIEPAINDFGGMSSQTAATAARAMRNADALARQATGFKGAKYSNIIEPRHAATVESVMQDLARASNAETLGRNVGSNTAQNLSMLSMLPALGGMHSTPTILALRLAGRMATKNREMTLDRQLAHTLLNPARTADLLEAARTPVSRKLLRKARVEALADKVGDRVQDAMKGSKKLRIAVEAAQAAGRTPRMLPATAPIAAATDYVSDPVKDADDLQSEYLGE